jgi:hypothetical protein
MIVHRLLDVFFRALDTVDMVRDRVDRVLGREPRPDPWAVSWPPAPEAAPPGDQTEPRDGRARNDDAEEPRVREAPAPKKQAKAKGKPAKKAATEQAETAKPRPGTKKPQAASRKGSVDRSGKDFDSPRARAIYEAIKARGGPVVAEEAVLDGKKVLARVVWALHAAEGAGSELGLTAADASALLHLCAGMEVFATNIARACRDETDLIEESVPDGRSKRYKLTAAGHGRAAQLATRPV